MEDYQNETETWEALKRWFKENRSWMLGGVVLGSVGVFGWNAYQKHVRADSEAAAVQYSQVLSALQGGDAKQAASVTEQLIKEHPGAPYGDQAELALAKSHVERNELEDAAKRLRGVMEKSDDKQLREVARVRLARVLVAQNKADDALKVIEGAAKDSVFAALYKELRGDLQLAKGNKAGALEEYQAAMLAVMTAPAGESVVDRSLLELKINDLSPAAGTPAAAPVKDAAATAPAAAADGQQSAASTPAAQPTPKEQ